jgi:geranylgeranyl diphosphate synthase, type I
MSNGTGHSAGHDVPAVLERARAVMQPALRAAVDGLADERMRRIAGYHLGWLDADGAEIALGGGKAVRPALVLLCAEAAGGVAADAVPPGVAVELVHNFSLLHDDIMDRDVERRHRPTAWTVFGEGQALLAGTAMLTAAIEVLLAAGPAGQRSLPCLLDAVQRLISGQSEDLALEGRTDAELDAVLHMEAGKTAALLSCSAALGALAVGAPPDVVDGLAAYGHELGMAFQLIDDILGITGDSAVTGKSASSDVRAGKRSAPIVAALSAGTDAAARLARHLGDGPPASEEDVTEATKLIDEAGGLEWAAREADRRLAQALAHLDRVTLAPAAREQLAQLARFVVDRDQ